MSEFDCPRAGKWIRGCRFEGRFDLSAATPVKIGEADVAFVSAVLDRYRTRTYVRDVCTTCGRTIERQGSAA